LFYILDRGPIATVAMPPQWTLVARDAFNGVLLWQRPIESWEWHLRGFRSGPTDLPRRLVAVGNRVYVTLGYGQPVVAVDAATGKTLRQYDETDNTQEIICCDGVLYLVVGEESPETPENLARRAEWTQEHGLPIYQEVRARTRLMAVDADSSRILWNKTADEVGYVMPTTLAVAQRRVFVQNTDHVICLDAEDGHEIWRAKRPVSRRRPAWTTRTLVVYDGVVLSADRAAPNASAEDVGPHVEWTATYHHTVTAKSGELIAFSADTGRRLWSAPCRESFNSPIDVLVAGGLVWTGNLVRAADPGILQGRDPHTGEIRRTRPRDQQFYEPLMVHARCYRHKATQRYLITGRSGVEFVDIHSGKAIPHHWVRGECQYGILPCNGLLYVPPHPCACFILAKLNSFHALAPDERMKDEGGRMKDEDGGTKDEGRGKIREGRLDKGPAYDSIHPSSFRLHPSGDWPTYRHDNARSGCAGTTVPTRLKQGWKTELRGRVSPPVVADDRLFVAEVDAHRVTCLDARAGTRRWSYTAGGSVDSPPTIHRGRVLFGCTDGSVYCLRAIDGELVWRFRACPSARRIVSYGRLESAWPVHGSVLVENDTVYFAAGRSSFLDGGIYLYGLDVATGQVLHTAHLDGPWPDLSVPCNRAHEMDGSKNDILVSNGKKLFLTQNVFDLELNQLDAPVTARHGAREMDLHLVATGGFLDDSGFDRLFWMHASRWPGLYVADRAPKAGQILVFDDTTTYGLHTFTTKFSRSPYFAPGAEGHELFADDNANEPSCLPTQPGGSADLWPARSRRSGQ
jgi:outer membrane protein assembly factor BamB